MIPYKKRVEFRDILQNNALQREIYVKIKNHIFKKEFIKKSEKNNF